MVAFTYIQNEIPFKFSGEFAEAMFVVCRESRLNFSLFPSFSFRFVIMGTAQEMALKYSI